MKMVLCSLALVCSSAMAIPLQIEKKMSSTTSNPYSVVAPLLATEPAAGDRVAGQLFFDISADVFKGVGANGDIKSLGSTSVGAKVTPAAPSYTGGYDAITFTSSNAVYDTGSYVGTNQFVAQSDGIHVITAYAVNALDSTITALQYRVNSGSWFTLCGAVGTTGAYAHCSGADQVNLTTGDTVSFQIFASTNNLTGIRLSISTVN